MKNNGIIYAALIVMVLVCGIVSASDEFTLQVNGVDYQNLDNPTFTWGDTIRFTGVNNISGSHHLSLGDPEEVIDWNPPRPCKGLSWVIKGATLYPITPNPDKTWGYTWDSGEASCKYPNVDTTLKMEVMGAGSSKYYTIKMKAIFIPTPTATPDYGAKIREIETKLSEQGAKVASQETKIQAQETKIKQIDEKTPAPTPVPTTIITTKTPIPTATIDHAATIAALEKHLSEIEAEQQKQGDFIYQIMKFLGLA